MRICVEQLSGRNGEGKSGAFYLAPLTHTHSPICEHTVLLKAIADKSIPGIAPNMRILLVTQIVDADASPLDFTITQAVVKADARREIALQEYESQSLLPLRLRSLPAHM